MKRSIIAALALAPAAALADETRPVDREETAESAAPHDPTEHFNFTNFDYRGKDEFGGPFGDGKMSDPLTGLTVGEEEPMSPPFVFMLLNFGLLLILLAKFGRPTARKLAEERHDQIKTALDDAARLRDQAAAKLADFERRIRDVDAEVKQLVEGIRADAEADKVRILEAAKTQAAQMKRDAELRIAAEIETARAQLTREVTIAATAATEKLLRDKLTSEDQRKLVSTFLADVEVR